VATDPIHLSVVIPTYNDSHRLAQAHRELLAFLRSQSYAFEIVLVDDGSAPGIAPAQADFEDAVIIRNPRNMGKGHAVRRGMLMARGTYRIYTDSDLPFSVTPIPPTLQCLEDGFDVVIGARDLPEADYRVPVSRTRRLATTVFNFFVRRIIGIDIPDTQCGYKGFRAAAATDLYSRSCLNSFSGDAEILYLAMQSNYRIMRVPVSLVRNESSSVSVARHAPGMLIDLVRLRLLHRHRGV
jgi:glycosyltransferase involved in cell wall biosynthesis